MLTLTEALNRVMNWLEKNQPEYADSFLPGLSREEIKAAEKKLGFKLPEEIYELYQWRNGTTEDPVRLPYTSINFLPLSDAIESSQSFYEYQIEPFINEEREWFKKSYLFILIDYELHEFCGIPLENCQTQDIPILIIFQGSYPELFHSNLKNMVLTVAECYESGAYYFNPEGRIEENPYKVAVIDRKYNSDLSNRALMNLEVLLRQNIDLSTYQSQKKIIEYLIIIRRFKDPLGIDLLLEALETWATVENYPKNVVIAWLWNTIGESRCPRDSIIFWVIYTLGEMGDHRAIKPIEKALDDSSLFVRKAAQKALDRLKSDSKIW